MRRVLFFLIFISAFSVSIAQMGLQVPQNPFGPMTMGKYPPPSWIRPGLTIVYQVEGGSRTAGKEGGSAYYSTGYMIMIVTDVVQNVVYGISIVCFTSPDIMLNPVQVYPLNGMAFMTPQGIQDMLKHKDEYAKDGIAVSGGRAQNGIFLTVTYKTTTTMVVIDDMGRILQFSYKSTDPNSSQVMMGKLLGYTTANWPVVNSFPQIAMGSYTYRVSTYTAMMGGYSSVVGTSQIRYAGVQGRVARYNQTFQTYGTTGMPAQQTNQVFGVPSYGPFYVHPSLLRVQTILNIPDINFRWYNTPSQSGYGIDSVIEIGGMEVARTTFDSRGLAIKSVLYNMGIYVVSELQRM